MKNFKNWRTGTALLIASAFIFTIGTGFSEWIFQNTIKVGTDNKGIPDVVDPVDDIKENYDFPDNVYTLYFFPQPITSTNTIDYDAKNIKSYSPKIKDKTYGYWPSTTGIDNEVAKNYGQYGYKKLVVTFNPTLQELEEIGTPIIDRKDNAEWPYQFMGWTANEQQSINYANEEATVTITAPGFDPQQKIFSKPAFTNLFNNDYQFADLTKDLAELDGGEKGDKAVLDGTDPGDNVIFLYPVFSSGKNYGTIKNPSSYPKYPMDGSSDQLIVRLESAKVNPTKKNDNSYINVPEKTFYFNQTWGKNSGPLYSSLSTRSDYKQSYYSYTGLRLEQGDQYYLTMDIPENNNGVLGWGGKWRTLNWEDAQVGNDTSNEATPSHFKNLLPNDVERAQDNPDGTNPGPFFLDAKAAMDQKTFTENQATFLKPGPGLYNIYVYVTWDQSGTTVPGKTDPSVSYFDDNLSPEKNVFLKTARYVRVFNKSDDGTRYGSVKGITNYTATVFVKVEKVEEPYLLTWQNSNNFTNVENGIRMFKLASSTDPNDLPIQKLTKHGRLTRAVDYYAFNVPVNETGTNHQINIGADKNAWYNDRFMAFSMNSSPVNKENVNSNRLYSGHYFETLDAEDINQIGKYSTITKKKDYDLPAGPQFANNSNYQSEPNVKFTASNVTTMTNLNGDGVNVGTNFSADFANKFNYHNFFSPNKLNDTNLSYYDASTYHFILRLYYYNTTDGAFNTSYVGGYTVLAVPRKIRKFNIIYFINSKDENKIARIGGLVDLQKTIKNLSGSTYYTTDMEQKYKDNTKTEPLTKTADSINLYPNGQGGNNIKSIKQMVDAKEITNLRDYLDESKKYEGNFDLSFDKVKIVLFDAV